MISVDGDTSTNDTVCIAGKWYGREPGDHSMEQKIMKNSAEALHYDQRISCKEDCRRRRGCNRII